LRSNQSARNPQVAREGRRRPALQREWIEAINPAHWRVYRSAIHAMQNAGVQFVLGGGFALAAYIGRWRDTKDIDFYILKPDRAKAVAALTRAGFKDYYRQLPYDRKWIYRSTRSGVIVDLIWSMANQRARADDLWLRRARPLTVHGETLGVLPLEEFLWCKLYIVQHDHCDWTDLFNLLYAAGGQVDWDHLFWRMDEDWPLLKALLTVYFWLCPEGIKVFPLSLRRKLQIDQPRVPRRRRRNRIQLLDTRKWFAALLPKNKPLEI
jgi:hypothetical protein